MNKQRIEALLEQAVELNPSRYYDSTDRLPDTIRDIYDNYSGSKAKHPDGFKLNVEESFGGEGQGEEYWYVLSLRNTNTDKVTYIRFNGWYQSYDGHEWHDGFDIVEPKEVTVTQWEAK